jgi:hypothetical protein
VRRGTQRGARVEAEPMGGDDRLGLGDGDDQAGWRGVLRHSAERRRRVTPDRAIRSG